jgi:triosephosphate isomerase
MHKTVAEARALAGAVVDGVAASSMADRDDRLGCDVVLCPPFTALAAVADVVRGSDASGDDARGSGVYVGAQDAFWGDAGAFTGAVAMPMVAELASHVIVGHSERRTLFGETDDGVNRKVHAAFAHNLVPIVCVGETAAARDEGRADAVVLGQLDAATDGIAPDEAERLVVAYEPVWAIGTGRACDAGEAARIAALVRARLAEAFGDRVGRSVRALYGGSVNPGNIAAYLAAEDVDGALVGGASLDAASFLALVNAARN